MGGRLDWGGVGGARLWTELLFGRRLPRVQIFCGTVPAAALAALTAALAALTAALTTLTAATAAALALAGAPAPTNWCATRQGANLADVVPSSDACFLIRFIFV